MRELTLDDPFVGLPIPTLERVLNFGRGVSALQVLVEWSLGAGVDNQLTLDVGAGFQMSLPATRVQMALILPSGAIDLQQAQGQTIPIPPNDPITGNPPSAWNATVIWGEVSRTVTFSSIAEWQLTRFMFVPAGTTQLIPIPQGADFVEAFETTTPAGATAFLTFLTGAGADVGQYSASATTVRRFPRVRIPGQAKSIDSGPILAGDDRAFSLIFTMRP